MSERAAHTRFTRAQRNCHAFGVASGDAIAQPVYGFSATLLQPTFTCDETSFVLPSRSQFRRSSFV